jgi:FemAB-related protein (PEP-CTERM system-associated)
LATERRLNHVELRHVSRQFDRLPVKQHKVAMILPLGSTREQAWDAIDRKARNQVRKAEKSGLTASVGGRERLDEFYQVFAQNMRDLGTPVYSRRFFSEVLDQNPDATRIVLVSKGEATVAAAMTYEYDDTIEVPWASSLQEYLALCPNNLLYWTILIGAVDRRLRYLDFGRSTPNEGTYRFKQQWGAVPHQMHWEYCLSNGRSVPDQSPKNSKFRRAIAIWQRLPVSVTRVIGPWIVRSIP